jgi:hypothetical protein
MNQIFTKLRMPMPLVIVTVGVGVALASLSLEAGWGQRCYNKKQQMYKCGDWWQYPSCQQVYDRRSGTCQELNFSCCDLANKKSYSGELPNDPTLLIP